MKLNALLSTLSAAAVLSACTSPPPRADAAAPTMAAATAVVGVAALPSVFEAGGIVRAKTTVVVSSRIMASVIAVHVRPGDRVRQGTTLVTLDAREITANRARAAADLAAAGEATAAAESEARVAETTLKLARITDERVGSLFTKRSATPQERDQAAATLSAAEAQVAAAQSRVAAAQAMREAAESTVSATKIAASYALPTAPFDAMVVQRTVDPGSMAAPGSPLLILEDPSAFRLEVALDEARAGSVEVGHSADFSVDDSGEAVWTTTRVAEIARVDPTSHSFLVKLDVPSDRMIRSGVFARARFHSAPHSALSFPASAVVRRGQLTFVFAVDADHIAHLQPVSIGLPADDRVEIFAGLRNGDVIVERPPASLADGTRIRADRPLEAAETIGGRR